MPLTNGKEPVRYGASFSSTATLSANTGAQVFSAASNARGAILHKAAAMSAIAAGSSVVSLIAHTASPTAFTQGDVIKQVDSPNAANGLWGGFSHDGDIFIPAGKGLFFFSAGSEASGYKNALYTLL